MDKNDIKEKVLSEKNTAIGAQAPNFKINDSQGIPFELSTLKGSYILLDFGLLGVCHVEEKTH